MGKVLSFIGAKGSFMDWANNAIMTATNVSFFRSTKGYAGLFNGSTSKIDAGTPDTLVGDKTFVAWVKPYGWGENSQGRIFDNGKLIIGAYGSSEYIIVSSDGATAAFTNAFMIILNKWNHVVVTRTAAGIATIYINGIDETFSSASGTPVVGSTNLIIGTNDGQTRTFDGLIVKAEIHDHLFTAKEIADEYKLFLNSAPIISEKFPKYGPWNKPHDTSRYQDEGLLLHYNMIKSVGERLVDISDNEDSGVAHGPIQSLQGLKCDGVDDYVSVNLPLTPAATVKTIAFRIKLATTTEMIYEGQSNDLLILANAGTLQASDYDKIYVNGVESDTVLADKWMNVVVTSSTVVDNNTPSLGYNSGTFDYGCFEIEDFQIWSTEWTDQDVKNHNNGFVRNTLVDDLSYEGVGNTPRSWRSPEGTYTVQEMVAKDSVLEHEAGTKYMESASSNKPIAIQSKVAHGTWYFSFYNDNNTIRSIRIPFISDRIGTHAHTIGYSFVSGVGMVGIYRSSVGGGVTVMNSSAAYVVDDTNYDIKIERTLVGVFTMWIRGGAHGPVWILANSDGGGSNPGSDNVNNTSEYFVNSSDEDSRVFNILVKNGLTQ